MTDETRRRQLRETLIATAKEMQEADRQRRLDTIRTIDKARRDLKRPYNPEHFAARLDVLFGGKKRTATIGK